MGYPVYCAVCGEEVCNATWFDAASPMMWPPELPKRGIMDFPQAGQIIHILGDEVHHGLIIRNGEQRITVGKPRIGKVDERRTFVRELRFRGLSAGEGLFPGDDQAPR